MLPIVYDPTELELEFKDRFLQIPPELLYLLEHKLHVLRSGAGHTMHHHPEKISKIVK